MNPLERFRHDETRLHDTIGLVAREVREARGELVECAAARSAMGHRSGCLLLHGDPGTGKSVAAARWLLLPSAQLARWFTIETSEGLEWRYRGPRCLWRSARSLARIQQYDDDAIEALTLPDRLVLDDFGVEYLDVKGFLRSLIDEIVQERHRRELPTIITANLTVAEFVERYGRRVTDRIAETGRPVVCAGPSFRTSRPTGPRLPVLATDAEVEARAAALVREQDARDAANVERWEREREERAAAPSFRVLPFRAAALAEAKSVEADETPAQIEERENEARREAERRLAEWSAKQGQSA